MSSEDENKSVILYLHFLTPFSSLASSFQQEQNLSRADNWPINKTFGLQKKFTRHKHICLSESNYTAQ